MNGVNLEYHPYRCYKHLLPFSFIVTVGSLLTIGNMLPNVSCGMFVMILLALLGLYFTKFLYDASKIIIHLETDGLRIIGDSCTGHIYISWKDLPYVYCRKNYRGFRFYVLSPKKLELDRQRYYIRRGGLSKILFDGVVVISVDNTQNSELLEQWIKEKVGKTGDGSLS